MDDDGTNATDGAQDTAPRPAGPAPFPRADLYAALTRPHLAIPLVLAQRARWIATVTAGRDGGLLVVLMLASSAVYALPYGLVLGIGRFWQIAALYLGSVAICLPSLHVFGAYLQVRLDLTQALVLGLSTACVASMFSFGFAPIFAFLSLTMDASSSAGTVWGLSALLLGASVFAGTIHLLRALHHSTEIGAPSPLHALMVAWQILLLFITYRMGLVLGLM